MVKGVAVKLKSYEETVPKLLKVIKFDEELKKHERIVLKVNLSGEVEECTNAEFAEQVIKFCIQNKNPGTEIFVAEGCDGKETADAYNELGYSDLSEKYGIGLVDLNNSEVEPIENPEFLKFEEIRYPQILQDSFVISLAQLNDHLENGISASLDNMVGAFPAKHYSSFFSNSKNKIKKHKTKYQIHDILKCKMPDFAMIYSPEKNLLFAGQPLEMDKQAAKSLGFEWQNLEHLKLVEESFSEKKKDEVDVDKLIGISS